MANKSGTSPQAVSLPVGGGSVRGLGENFQPDLSTGTGVYNVPLEFPKGPNGLTPQFNLTYNTAFGNGPFGVGWALNLPSITRKVERGIPTFNDERDTFLIAGEEMVHIGDDEYRMKVEREFTRFFRRGDYWEGIKRDGQRLVFGRTAQSRVEVTRNGETLAHKWCLEELADSNGNTIHFEYLRHGDCLYLRTITYAIYRIELSYEARPDPFSTFRTGFEIRTAFRCTSIALKVQPLGNDAVRTWQLDYDEAPLARLSLLTRITLSGFDAETGESLSFPSLELGYTKFEPEQRRYQRFKAQSGALPPGLDDPNAELIDLEGHGLPGVLVVENGRPRYWSNRGHLRWAPPRTLPQFPAVFSLGDDRVRFADMDGNGSADLLVGRGPFSGYYENQGRGRWERFVHYQRSPGLEFSEGDLHLVDINGDGLIDAVHAGRTGLHVFENRGSAGWDPPKLVPRSDRALDPPDLSLDDPRIRLADMSGDGLLDVVLIKSGHIEYWPHLGNGHYANSRVMNSPPRFPYPFDPARVFLTDVNGDGLTDVIYVSFDQVTYWINQSGNAFSAPQTIRHTPPTSNIGTLRVADMNGAGMNGLLWTEPFPEYRYLDFTGDVKPNLLQTIDNSLGLVTTINYSTSTDFARRDLEAGHPWETYLPFPVQVVSEIVAEDTPARTTNRVQLIYHDGHFDSQTRQYIGFGRVEQLEFGDASEPTSLIVSHFHNRKTMSTQASGEAFNVLRRLLFRTEVFGRDGSPEQDRPHFTDEIEWEARELTLGSANAKVFFPVKAKEIHTTFERDTRFARLAKSYTYDEAGNCVQETKVGDWLDDQDQPQQLAVVTETTYAASSGIGTTTWPARQRKWAGTELLKEIRNYYDGAAFTGLPIGQATKGNVVRVEEVLLTQALVDNVYGLSTADMEALGYRADSDPDFGTLFTRDVQRLRVNSFGCPEEKMDVRGLVTTIEYDANNIFPTRFVDPRGFESLVTYHLPDGQVERYTDVNGNEGRYEFDAIGRVKAFRQAGTPPDKPGLEFEYHTESVPQFTVQKVRLSRDDANTVRTFKYADGHGRSIQQRTQAESGRVAVSAQPVFNNKNHAKGEFAAYFSTSFGFDATEPENESVVSSSNKLDVLGREVEMIDPTGGRLATRFRFNHIAYFDAVHSSVLDVNANAPAPRTEYFDAFSRLVAVREQNGSEFRMTRYEYDPTDNLVRGIDALGHEFFHNTYDLMGHKIRVKHPESGTQVRLFNSKGDLIEQRNADGGIAWRSYDDIGRQLEVRFGGPTGALQERHFYDGGPGEDLHGRVSRVEGQFGSVEYSYHPSGRIKSTTRTFAGLPGSFSIQTEINIADKLTKVVYPDGFSVALTYGEGGLLNSISGVIDDIDYGPTGKRELIRFANGLETSYRYEPGVYWLREQQTTQTASGVKYQHLLYDHDAAGNVTVIDDLANLTGKVRNNRRYTYDDLYQLIRAEGRDAGGDYQHEYRYDALGNIISKPDAFAQDFVYGAPNRPTLVTGLSGGPPNQFQYDDSGNLTRMPGAGLEYDPLGRLVRVTAANGTVVEYVYDHEGFRTATHATRNGTTQSEFNFDNLFLIRGADRIKLIWDDIQKVAQIDQAGNGAILHTDHIGNVNILSALNNGAFSGQTEYYPFGATAVSISMPTDFLFNSKQVDTTTGLYFFGARFYSPQLGRFITPDPFLQYSPHRGQRKPISLHLYGFVMNNPINVVDPNGLWFGLDDAIVAGIGFVGGVIGGIINGADTWDEILLSGLAGAAGAWLLWNLAPVALGMIGADLSFLGSSSLLAGYMGAVTFGVAYAGLQIIGTAITRGLDEIDSPIAGFFSFLIKFAMSPITTTIGLLIGFVRTGFGLWGNVHWFKGGTIVFQTNENSPTFGGAMTWGATVQWQGGQLSGARLQHELHHSRQFVFGGDGFGLTWATIGGTWGLVESWIDKGSPSAECWISSSTGHTGNPLENRAHDIYSPGAC
ncbi:toxin TcdB middle/N-terminal domain-containing protein [Nitrosospira briensis]|uniref:toxin TcdB middle/N-terminal domain-containing protein n=1 Tax=Nitrosospira briensis TaxID=35799 RepID=UPI0008EA191C|nr:toxin TcdB middle/N-terminal domain-containing protein [Nitrosospira briensis]SFN75529.1 RHS repeat-associated core domain-containing protein [Nitrosospira briensis]